MTESRLAQTLADVASRSAASIVAHRRIASPGLNAALLRRMSAMPGEPGSFLASPVFEAARAWEAAPVSLDDLSGELLHPDLVEALDSAQIERMPRDRHPYRHQFEAWTAAREGLSCLVTSGTGSGKTECFMVPMLDDLLRDPAKGRLSGVRAIVIYPLNALIESQRERLAAWTEKLSSRISFALFNGLTPETKRKVTRHLAKAELGDRRSIRETPPSILITNVTMLEYLLLRSRDQPILQKSQGLLRWIVLDEAHGYIGAQAAEMALLLRRVRAAFGVGPEDVRLMATSATISEGDETEGKLKKFVADLAGLDEGQTRVIEGRAAEAILPRPGEDMPLEPDAISNLPYSELWDQLAPHPRVQRLKATMMRRAVTLKETSQILFDRSDNVSGAQTLLDASAQATAPESGQRLLPWRAHLFHRAQGGLWACVDPACAHRDPELVRPNSGWGFGAVWFDQRDHCDCGAPVFEIEVCIECGAPHLAAGREAGALARLVPLASGDIDDFAVDEEPDIDSEAQAVARDRVWLAPAIGDDQDRYLAPDDGTLFDNDAPEGRPSIAVHLIEDGSLRGCCAGAQDGRLQPARYGPPFFMGNVLPTIIEQLAPPAEGAGLPMSGRRAISFSDSRQGVARLAAKLQQDAERGLTRAFLYHAVQEDHGPSDAERAAISAKLEKMRAVDPEMFSEEIKRLEADLHGGARPISWIDLVKQFGQQPELREFATEVWAERDWGGREMAEAPEKLAEMFLYRELFRRPRVQNNAETMGLVELTFPNMETVAATKIPAPLEQAGMRPDDWVGLAQAAADLVFRDNFAVNIQDDKLARWVNPRRPGRRSVFSSSTSREDVTEKNAIFWPKPKPSSSRPSRLLRLIYRSIVGTPDSVVDQDRAGEVLWELWNLITKHAARDAGAGAWRLDFSKAAVARLDKGWLCPVTRRILGYNPGGFSPFNPEDGRALIPVEMPRLPKANPGGLTQEDRRGLRDWCEKDPSVSALRETGIWTDLHDRIASYAPFLRAQEHSAQIERPVLQIYEDNFKEGRINLLNCSTTMEMGVDIPNVAVVINANVPPSVSNYRQRVGRAGRRGEPWAFAMTFCRNLPLDWAVYEAPSKILSSPIAAPSVRLDSAPIVVRHVHAALLAAFIHEQAEGFDIRASTGAFFGAGLDPQQPVEPDNPADAFLLSLLDENFWELQEEPLRRLTLGTIREGRSAEQLCAETAETFETLLLRWRTEYAQLIESAGATTEQEVRQAYEIRARRMRGEFLISELARRGFTPAYGFPVDVVAFDHLSGGRRGGEDFGAFAFGEHRGGASRTLDVAIREYAPGAEIVINGMVHQSEGVQPAWAAMADASGLEDLQFLWECPSCRAFGLVRMPPTTCPHCSGPEPRWHRALRPAGFLGRRAPHTGYESLSYVPFEMPRLTAAGAPWQALPDPDAGRLRADPGGLVINRSSGSDGRGYALCLACGRAAPEHEEPGGVIPEAVKRHKPLAPVRADMLVRGHCPGGLTHPERIQRNVRLVQETRTDVFELQLPRGQSRSTALALSAALREALSERLGAEAREIGIAAGPSQGPSNEARVSAFLFDRAAGGAGLAARLAEPDWFVEALSRASQRLDCREDCEHGCPACILRPDLNFGDDRPDRRQAAILASDLAQRCDLPPELRVFGPNTRVAGFPLADWLERRRLAGDLTALTIYLHGAPSDWELADWPATKVIERLSNSKCSVEIVISSSALIDAGFDMARKLDLHRLSFRAKLSHMNSLPMLEDVPLLALAQTGSGWVGLAATAPEETIPGSDWGLGSQSPSVRGPASEPLSASTFPPQKLLELSSGNARLIWIQDELDGPAARFGAGFWKLLAQQDLLTIAALKSHGVKEAIYSDRYLVSPLNLRLLYEVLLAMPGRSDGTRIGIQTAQLDQPPQMGWAIFHNFPEDKLREDTIRALLPSAAVRLSRKSDLPHARCLTLQLGDGRRLRLLLDQGFGAWRAAASPKHDFRAPPATQASALRRTEIRTQVSDKRGAPILLEMLS